MKKRLHNNTAIFILFVFALFANELTAQLTFTASPELVTEFNNGNSRGTTTLTWSGTGVTNTIVTYSRTLTSGGTPTTEGLVSAKGAGGSQDYKWVSDGYTYTFYLYEGTQADFNNGTLGALLGTVDVVGESPAVPATATINASPEVVTDFPNKNGRGDTTITWSSTGVTNTILTHTLVRTSGGTASAVQLAAAAGITGTKLWPFIVDEFTHTFRVYEGTQADFNSGNYEDVLATIVVVGNSSTVGIEDIKINDIAFDVFPNPVGDVLHIETASKIQALRIYSITGQKLEEVTTDSSKNITIDVSDLDPSIYIVQITNLEGMFSKRFVKK